jgi:hypothetical protein
MAGETLLLDLNFPRFQEDLFKLDPSNHRPVFKTLRKLRGMDWQSVYRDRGLNWEKIKGSENDFTIRLSRQSRAVVRRDGRYLRFIALRTDHDKAYGKR